MYLYGDKELQKVSWVIIHPDFIHAGLGSDVALLQLAESVQSFPNVKPVKLSSESLEVTKKDVCWVTGWGAVSMHSKFWGGLELWEQTCYLRIPGGRHPGPGGRSQRAWILAFMHD